ncbi:hypothetical protein LCGC14_1928780 [marine sediment metagenome]|uniref:Uncharacterized protein n=1 Tax=marine sediment metagenome TaxID=412755 RepID=A0A0F9FNM3_9ZZZZ
MARGTPDWVRATEISVSIGGVSIVPTTAQQVAAGGVGRYSGTDQTYQEVVKWTVAAEKVGEALQVLGELGAPFRLSLGEAVLRQPRVAHVNDTRHHGAAGVVQDRGVGPGSYCAVQSGVAGLDHEPI